MKRLSQNIKAGIRIILFVMIVILGIMLIFRPALAASLFTSIMNGPPPPTDVPPNYQAPGYRTTTPDGSMKLYPTVYSSATPITLSKTTDLSPNLDKDQKFDIYVHHADGTYELYLIGPLPAGTDLRGNKLPPEILNSLKLKPGDTIWGWTPPVPWRMDPPTEAPTSQL